MPDVQKVMDVCNKHGVKVIEDCAHALGNTFRGQALGTFGNASCVSFQSNKIIDAGEGGMLATNDPELHVIATLLSGCYEKNFVKHFDTNELAPLFAKHLNRFPCYNFRITNLQSTIIRHNLMQLGDRVERFHNVHASVLDNLESKYIERITEVKES